MKASSIREKIIFPTALCFALGLLTFTPLTIADRIYTDDLVVQGSLCVGLDCVNGESFNYDTIRLKENNVRIKFQDSSTTGSFPSNDWQITANDSANGGANKFSIEDITGSKVPFTITAGAPNNSIFVTAAGYVGFNTSAPLVQMHTKHGNSPALRLEQDGSSGFTAQSWDVAGNETNFFIRDATNSGKIPFKIRPSAPNNSIYINSNGDIGFETSTPDGIFDIAHPSDANNHAVLVSSAGLFGVNVGNSFNPLGLFDVQTTGGVSRLLVNSSGNVGIGSGTSGAINGRFEVKSLDATSTYFNVDASGDIGIGTESISGRFDIRNSANTSSIFTVSNTGRVGIGTTLVPDSNGKATLVNIAGEANMHGVMLFDSPSEDKSSSIKFTKAGAAQWDMISANDWDLERLRLDNKVGVSVMSWEQSGKVGFSVVNVDANKAIQHSNGAHLTTSGVWTNASSREYKEDITEIDVDIAQSVLAELNPVTYFYKKQPGELYAGFIAEEVPELVASSDRKGLASMDIVAVLTKVVQQQEKMIKALTVRIEGLEESKK